MSKEYFMAIFAMVVVSSLAIIGATFSLEIVTSEEIKKSEDRVSHLIENRFKELGRICNPIVFEEATDASR